ETDTSTIKIKKSKKEKSINGSNCVLYEVKFSVTAEVDLDALENLSENTDEMIKPKPKTENTKKKEKTTFDVEVWIDTETAALVFTKSTMKYNVVIAKVEMNYETNYQFNKDLGLVYRISDNIVVSGHLLLLNKFQKIMTSTYSNYFFLN
ncbi:MAG: hypothetical protein FWG20_07440, partial [Candidatus Cloacimonetes bacterium]|nr:hypothetical protein [Candidatus Cloacimonadota bacterium]